MSKPILQLSAKVRKDAGKGASRRLRRQQGLMPAIIYGAGQPAVSLTIKHNEIWKAIEHEVFFSSILTIEIDGKKEQAVVKDLQRHPYKELILHMDLLRVSAKQALVRNVPLHFTHEEDAPGVKVQGGMVNHHLTELEIKCLPADLPEFIEISIIAMELDATMRLTDVKLPKGIELAHAVDDDAHDHPVVSIHIPKRVAAETAPTEEAAEPVNAEKEKTDAS